MAAKFTYKQAIPATASTKDQEFGLLCTILYLGFEGSVELNCEERRMICDVLRTTAPVPASAIYLVGGIRAAFEAVATRASGDMFTREQLVRVAKATSAATSFFGPRMDKQSPMARARTAVNNARARMKAAGHGCQ